jgi:hypothetical protein
MTDPLSSCTGLHLGRSQDYSAMPIVGGPVWNSKAAHDSFSHRREVDPDDLVLATAMACWFREARYARTEERYAKEERNRLKARWYSNSEGNGRS